MLRYVLGAGVLAALSGSVFGSIHADSVVSYTPGGISATYQNPSGALGELSPTMNYAGSFVVDGTTFNFFDDTLLTAFNAAYNPDQIVGIGPGGELTLHLNETVATNGKTLGVHAAVGLNDFSWPHGQNFATAETYTDPRVSEVRVARDLGGPWVSLGVITFQNPSNYYDQGVTDPASTNVAGSHQADFGKPFLGNLSDFDNQDWDGTLGALDGSAGGQWLDLSGTGLDGVNYVQFVVAPGAGDLMYVDALAGVPVPEPTCIAMIIIAGPLLLARSRRRELRRTGK